LFLINNKEKEIANKILHSIKIKFIENYKNKNWNKLKLILRYFCECSKLRLISFKDIFKILKSLLNINNEQGFFFFKLNFLFKKKKGKLIYKKIKGKKNIFLKKLLKKKKGLYIIISTLPYIGNNLNIENEEEFKIIIEEIDSRLKNTINESKKIYYNQIFLNENETYLHVIWKRIKEINWNEKVIFFFY
jgi:hypothetical protein